ncbi:MAG TPA: hypothetical protein VIV11_34700 [Kofleriaceae bacterium]
MRKLAVLAALALALVLASKPADACRGGSPCPPAVKALGYTVGAALAGGYAYGVGYLIYHDVTDADQTLNYGVMEMSINGLALFATGGGTLAALADREYRTAAVLAPFAALHTTLMVHGGWRVYRERDDFRAPANGLMWLGGTAFVTNALIWTSQLRERRGRGFGIAEAAVNGPLAIGLGFVAYDRFASWRGGAGFVYGGMAAISAGFTYHGLKTAISPAPPKIDVNSMDLYPTAVSDGIEIAPGLGASGTW